ncbi:MAG: hypothetical protein KAT83_02105 [Candidatus Aenigmarchaeota archaeon]|nr:hypothetical protein [Candidatus Aenigmarchaeota archaeon]
MDFEFGYVCGVLCGNGHILHDKKNGNYGVSLESDDVEALRFFSCCLHDVFETKTKIISCKRKHNAAKSHILYCYNKKTSIKILDAFRGSFGTQQWMPPKKAHTTPVFRTGFLKGFFDHKGSVRIRYKKSGGCLEKVRNIRASSVNLRGLFAVKELLILEGIQCIIYRCKTLHVLDIEGKNRLETYQKKINFTSPEKKKRLENAIRFMTSDEMLLGKRTKILV